MFCIYLITLFSSQHLWEMEASRWQWFWVFCSVPKVRDQLFLLFGLKLRLNWVLIAFLAGPCHRAGNRVAETPSWVHAAPPFPLERGDAFFTLLFSLFASFCYYYITIVITFVSIITDNILLINIFAICVVNGMGSFLGLLDHLLWKILRFWLLE